MVVVVFQAVVKKVLLEFVQVVPVVVKALKVALAGWVVTFGALFGQILAPVKVYTPNWADERMQIQAKIRIQMLCCTILWNPFVSANVSFGHR